MSNQAICFQQPLAPIVNGSTGAPYASGTVGLYTVGTLTPLAVFSDIGLSVTLTNPVPINASGYTSTSPIGTPTPVYLSQSPYDYYIYDSLGATVLGPVTVAGSAWPGALQGIVVASPAANANAYANRLQSTINKATSGTHALFAGVRVDPPTIGAGASTLTEAATVYIVDAPSGGSLAYALHVPSGTVRIDGRLNSLGITSFGAFNESITIVAFSATPVFDLSLSNNFTITLTGNITPSVTNWPTGGVSATAAIRLLQDGSGGHSTTLPGGWKWAGGSAPTLTTTANKASIIVLYSPDSGTSIYPTLYTDNA